MKNYIRPSVNVSKFDVADIITDSGVVQKSASFETGSVERNLYDAYLGASSVDSGNVAVFQW